MIQSFNMNTKHQIFLPILLCLFIIFSLTASSQCNSTVSCESIGFPNHCCSQYGFCGTSIEACFPDTCVNSCQELPIQCGDNVCAPGESCTSCPKDCGPCVSNTIYTKCVNNFEYALTFDDGPSNVTDILLDILQSYNVTASFFLIGDKIENYPATIQRMLAENHTIYDHTFSHSNLTLISTPSIIKQVLFGDIALRKFQCNRQVRLFRPPYGSHNSSVDSTLETIGYQTVMWNLDTRDWEEAYKPNGTSLIVNKTLSLIDTLLPQGIIHLQHDVTNVSVQAVPDIIEYALSKNYTFVSLDQCLGNLSSSLWSQWLSNDPKTCVDPSGHAIGGGNCTSGADCGNWHGQCIHEQCVCYPGWSCPWCTNAENTISTDFECPVIYVTKPTNGSDTFLFFGLFVFYLLSLFF